MVWGRPRTPPRGEQRGPAAQQCVSPSSPTLARPLPPPVTFEEARAAFPVLERYAYLNAGTNGPLARATVEAMLAEQLTDLARGRGGKQYIEHVLALREQARASVAAVLGVEPSAL